MTRFAFIDTVPNNLQPDSVDTIRHFLEKRTRGESSFFTTNWNGSHIINQWLIALPWYILGQPYWAVHLSSATMSLLIAVLFFIFLKEATKSTLVAFVGSLWLLVDPWFLNFSRSGWENIANCLMVVLLLYAQVREEGDFKKRAALLIIVSLISPYLYHPGKIISGLAVILLAISILRRDSLVWRTRLSYLFIFILIWFIWLLPFLSISAQHQLDRISAVSIFSQVDPWLSLVQNLKNNFLAFAFFQDSYWHVGINGRYLPLEGWVLYPPLIVFYWLGILSSLWKRRIFLFVGIVLIWPINILSLHTPDAARTLHALPFIYLMISLGLHLLISQISRFINRLLVASDLRASALSLFNLTVLIFAIGLALHQFTTYWVWINQPRTLKSREPAIYRDDYEQWLREMRRQLKVSGRTLNINEWDAQRAIPTL